MFRHRQLSTPDFTTRVGNSLVYGSSVWTGVALTHDEEKGHS
jgi:hypothetical protein